jgi:hypothetical protein
MQIMLHKTAQKNTPLGRNRSFLIEQREKEMNYRQRYKQKSENDTTNDVSTTEYGEVK